MLYPSHFSYCIQTNTTIIPEDWLCEICQSKHDSTAPRKVNQVVGSWASSKRNRSVRGGKVKYLDLDEVIRLSSGKASAVSKNVISKIPSSLQTQILLKYLGSFQEIMKYERSHWLTNMLLAHYLKVGISLHLCFHSMSILFNVYGARSWKHKILSVLNFPGGF